jgi:hypothetical protein
VQENEFPVVDLQVAAGLRLGSGFLSLPHREAETGFSA